MSKFVKDLLTRELQARLDGVQDALLVNVVGMDVQSNTLLRKQLREKGIELLVVKNSLAQRATEGTPLAPAFEGVEGTLAVCWGGDDIVALAKEVTRLAAEERFAPFAPRGGVLDGERLSEEDVQAVSKWPTREEQLSLLVGQILSPGAMLASQLTGPGSLLASQIESRGDEQEA